VIRLLKIVLVVGLVIGTHSQCSADGAMPVEFARDIRPIFSANCFHCHGPDEQARESDLRLDLRRDVLGEGLDAGVIVPGRPEDSKLFLRITAPDDEGRMPPPEEHGRLKPEQIELMRQWIVQGAPWQPHWAFVPPKRPVPPLIGNGSWVRNPIDAFVLSRLRQQELAPSPEADKRTLIRRVALDLTGLPPTVDEIHAFLADDSPQAYERLVDRLLDSPRYGERTAAVWLDAARYADTYGYQDDGEVSMWRWRDWVIDAFNKNMPFDQFTVEQLAGDLLPNPTLDQLLATGFNRNHRANAEGGSIPEEFRTEYVVDRVDATATTWMGLTMVCGRCHDHKYDPITQREFYEFFAFFNNVPEDGRARKKGNTPPMMDAPTRPQLSELEKLDTRLREVRHQLRDMEPLIAQHQQAWEESLAGARLADFTIERKLEAHFPFDGAVADASGRGEQVQALDGEQVYCDGKIGEALVFDGEFYVHAGNIADYSDDERFTLAAWVYPEGARNGSIISRTKDEPRPEGYDLLLRDGHVRVHLNVQWVDDAIRLETKSTIPAAEWTHVAVTVNGSMTADGVAVYINGVRQDVDVEIDSLYQSFGNNGPLRIGASGDPGSRFRGRIDDARAYAAELTAAEVAILAVPRSVAEIVHIPARNRTADERHKLRACYLARGANERIAKALAQVAALESQQQALIERFPSVMVMAERPQSRPTRILFRGQYDQPRDEVRPGVPAIFPPLRPEFPANRLALALWLVDPRHPLTARVAVNRFWQMSFRDGLVRTAEDFGSQGEAPSNPLLLDWLAREFADGGWNVKALRRLIVTSAAYRQSSAAAPASWAADPQNRLLSRGPRFRLSAEMIRDSALFASGLLVEELGGPSVRPYQPPRLWEDLSNDQYVQDHGEKLYRRSLYIFWKRTVPFPALALFDASDRETCVVRKERTNTPLQALALMNETAMVEASRCLAERAMREFGSSPEDRLASMFETVVGRPPSDDETRVLLEDFQWHLMHFREHEVEAAELIAIGERSRDPSLDKVELAAYTAVANLALNLDEAITQH